MHRVPCPWSVPAIVLVLSTTSACSSTDEFRDLSHGLAMSEQGSENEDRARSILKRMREVQGMPQGTAEGPIPTTITFRDRFVMPYSLVSPWPGSETLIRIDFLSYADGALPLCVPSRVEFLEGASKGEVWGITCAQSYTVTTDGALEWWKTDLISTYATLMQVATHRGSIPHAAFLGERSAGGTRYDLVLVSFGKDLLPRATQNQYVLWVEHDTGRLGKLEMTDRRFSNTAYGCLDLAQFSTMDGQQRPGQISMKSECDDDEDDYLHRIQIESWARGDLTRALTQPGAK